VLYPQYLFLEEYDAEGFREDILQAGIYETRMLAAPATLFLR